MFFDHRDFQKTNSFRFKMKNKKERKEGFWFPADFADYLRSNVICEICGTDFPILNQYLKSKMKYLFSIFSIFLLLNLSSCDKGFEELNKNPLAPTAVNSEALFNELVNSLRLGWSRQLFLHNEILYDVTELGVVTAKTFGNVDGGVEEVWTNYYTALKNKKQLELNLDASASEDPEIGEVIKTQATILMAYKTFQMLDFFGDIPYFEAGNAYAATSVLRPKYDDDKEIYLSLLEELRTASDFLIGLQGNTSLGNSYLRVGTSDALFGDNTDSWLRFSNTMLLKYFLRIHEKEPAIAAEGIANLINNGYSFVSAPVVMLPADQGWSNEGVNWSFREHNRLRMGTTAWNFMTENGEIIDPRARIFFDTNNEDEWVPFPQISNNNTPQSGGEPYQKDRRDNSYENKGAENIYSSFNFYLIRDEKKIPEILMTEAEVKFILAEIFLKGIGIAPEESLASFRYQEGMLSSLDFWQEIMINATAWENRPNELSTGELFAISELPRYKFNVGADLNENLRKIQEQRWIHYFRQPWEAFSLIRRTNLLPREKSANTFFRFKYPNSETTFNFDNWSEQVNRMGGDETNVMVWWMN